MILSWMHLIFITTRHTLSYSIKVLFMLIYRVFMELCGFIFGHSLDINSFFLIFLPFYGVEVLKIRAQVL